MYDSSPEVDDLSTEIVVSYSPSLLSGDTILSSLTGSEILFVGDKSILENAVNTSALQGLGMAVYSPRAEAASTMAQAEDNARNALAMMLIQLAASFLAIVLAAYAFVVQNSKKMALQTILGYGSVRRTRPLLIMVVLSVTFGALGAYVLGYLDSFFVGRGLGLVACGFLAGAFLSTVCIQRIVVDFRRDLGRV